MKFQENGIVGDSIFLFSDSVSASRIMKIYLFSNRGKNKKFKFVHQCYLHLP